MIVVTPSALKRVTAADAPAASLADDSVAVSTWPPHNAEKSRANRLASTPPWTAFHPRNPSLRGLPLTSAPPYLVVRPRSDLQANSAPNSNITSRLVYCENIPGRYWLYCASVW